MAPWSVTAACTPTAPATPSCSWPSCPVTAAPASAEPCSPALAWARAQPDVHKVTLQVWPHNDRALALYRHAGFIVEGYRHRHWRRADGELWDVIEMGLLVES